MGAVHPGKKSGQAESASPANDQREDHPIAFDPDRAFADDALQRVMQVAELAPVGASGRIRCARLPNPWYRNLDDGDREVGSAKGIEQVVGDAGSEIIDAEYLEERFASEFRAICHKKGLPGD